MHVVTGHGFIKKFLFFKNIVHRNGYPDRIFDNCVNTFLNSKHNAKERMKTMDA